MFQEQQKQLFFYFCKSTESKNYMRRPREKDKGFEMPRKQIKIHESKPDFQLGAFNLARLVKFEVLVKLKT